VIRHSDRASCSSSNLNRISLRARQTLASTNDHLERGDRSDGPLPTFKGDQGSPMAGTRPSPLMATGTGHDGAMVTAFHGLPPLDVYRALPALPVRGRFSRCDGRPEVDQGRGHRWCRGVMAKTFAPVLDRLSSLSDVVLMDDFARRRSPSRRVAINRGSNRLQTCRGALSPCGLRRTATRLLSGWSQTLREYRLRAPAAR